MQRLLCPRPVGRTPQQNEPIWRDERERSDAQFDVVKQGLHFSLGVTVAGSTRRLDSTEQTITGLFGAARLYQCLPCHLVTGSVIRVLGNQQIEILESAGDVIVVRLLDGQTVPGKRIVGVLGQNFGQHRNLVHTLIVGEYSPTIGAGPRVRSLERRIET